MTDPLRQPTASQRNALVRLWQWLFRGLLFIWVTVVLGLALNVGATWLTTKGFDPTGTPLEFIIQDLPVVIACGGGLLVLTIVARMLGRQDESSVAHSQPTLLTQQNRSVLIHLLRNEYRRQMTESLQGVTMMALALQQQTDVVLSSVSLVSWHMDAPDNHSSVPAPIVQAYNDAGTGLLLLGAPGAGKSTLLRELASELIIRAEQDVAQAIPVVVNLSSWAIKKPPLTTWMADRLWETYDIPPRLSQALIEQDQLLLLLDGLDEVELSARTDCIKAINAYRAEHFLPVVVCSRSREYLEQEERLRLPLAVEVRPLASEQVDGYLKGAGKPLAAVRATLRSNTTLGGLVTTPLMLSVVMLAYRGKTVKDLPQLGSAEDQQRQVFEHYVTRMLEQPTRKWHFTSQQTCQWLIWLAQQMKQQGLTEFYLERLQLSWLPTQRVRNGYAVLGRRAGALLVRLLSGKDGKIQPSEKLVWSWKFFWLGLLIGLMVGPLFGLLIGWFMGLSDTQINEHARLKPNQGIQTSGWNALRSGLLSILISGLFSMLLIAPFGVLFGIWSFGLLRGLLIGLLFGLLAGLLFGLLAGLLLGLRYGGAAYLAHYCLRFLLWRSGAMPWHYVRFLEEATDRILLQRVGGGYRFIHPLFQEYFASLGAGTSASAQSYPLSPHP